VFIDSYLKLCRVRGVSPTRVLDDLGLSHSLYARWKNGGQPTNPTILKLADYFKVSIDELMDEQIEKPAAKNDELNDNIIKFLTIANQLPPERLSLLEDFAIKLLHMK